MMSKLPRYYHTLKYLKPIQWYGQIFVRLKKPKIKKGKLPAQREQRKEWIASINKPSPIRESNKLSFLQQEYNIEEKKSWSDANIEKLWLYHLHYFDILNSSTETKTQQAFITRWIKENPPGQGVGFDPYPLSLRIVNWIKWALAGHSLTETMLESLAIQIRYLYQCIEIHILGNHLFANAKALLFGGLFFSSREAMRWQHKGLSIFKQQLKAQVLQDGGHFELSPMYHCTILEDILDIINLYQTYDEAIPDAWLMQCEKMMAWLNVMSHPDGEIAFFNDAALKVAPNYQSLMGYAKRLGFQFNIKNHQPLIYLPQSGYSRIQCGDAVLLADIAEVGASYQPGHAHADTLSFELSIGKERCLVNSGTSTYTEGSERSRERSTAAHNTLVVNERNSSDVWKSFRVARRAHVFNISLQQHEDNVRLAASHDGYKHAYHIIHTRTWMMKPNELSIEDALEGAGSHKIAIYFHCHPDIEVNPISETCVSLTHKNAKWTAILAAESVFTIMDNTYHPQFNCSIKSKKIVFTEDRILPTVLRTSIKWS